MENARPQVKTGLLFNKMLLLFMIAMILANMGGEMYGILQYPYGKNSSYRRMVKDCARRLRSKVAD